jgi:lysozyme
MITSRLIQAIKDHEGFSSYAYYCPAGRITIGWGRCIDEKEKGTGITEPEAEVLLQNDLLKFEQAAKRAAGTDVWDKLSQVRREALVEMAFNMGEANLKNFKNMMAALEKEDYAGAWREALDSRWANQVGKRAHNVAERLLFGKYAGS